MEMSATDPSLFPLESLSNDDYFNVPFDLTNDFELSPFLASLTTWDIDTPLSPIPDTIPLIQSSHSPRSMTVSGHGYTVQHAESEQSADMAPPGPAYEEISPLRVPKKVDKRIHNALEPNASGERTDYNYVEFGLGSQFLGAASSAALRDLLEIDADIQQRVPFDRLLVNAGYNGTHTIRDVSLGFSTEHRQSTQTEAFKIACPVHRLSSGSETSPGALRERSHPLPPRMTTSAASGPRHLNVIPSVSRRADMQHGSTNSRDREKLLLGIESHATAGINVRVERSDRQLELSQVYYRQPSNTFARKDTTEDMSPKDLPLRAVTESSLSSAQNTKVKVATSRATALALGTLPALFCAISCLVFITPVNLEMPMYTAALAGMILAMSGLVVQMLGFDAIGSQFFGKVDPWEHGKGFVSSVRKGNGVATAIGSLASRYAGCIL